MRFASQGIINTRTAEELAHTVWTAHGYFSRLRGLIARPPLAAGCALWIQPCNQIHTHFLAYAIDAVFVAHDWRVLKVTEGIRPWRILPPVRGARAVLEFCGLRAGSVQAGDVLRLEPLR